MALKYKLVKCINLGKDKLTVPQKIYARPVYSEKVAFEDLLSDIVEAGVPTSQVRAVIDRINYMVKKHLLAGHIVQFGDLGNFRYSIGSTGSLTEEEFKTSQIKRPRIVFSPSVGLKKTHLMVNLQKIEPVKEEGTEECDRPHAD